MNAGGALRRGSPALQRRAVFFEFMIFSAFRRLFSRAMAPYGGLGASTANAQNARFCQGTKPMRCSEALRPSRGFCASAGRDGAFSKQLFRPDVSVFVEICLRRRRASLHKPRRRAPFVPGRGRSAFLARGSAARGTAAFRCKNTRGGKIGARIHIFPFRRAR